MRLAIFIVLLFAFLSPASAADAASKPAPQWYLDDIEFLTSGSGRWVASNAAYQSDDEPMTAYVIEWNKGYANSMTGRLFGIVDGKETQDFWRFRQYWHPGEGKAYLEQFGIGGAFGVGPMQREDDKTKMEQVFYAPDGSASVTGHLSHNPGAHTHVTDSFDVIDGEWKPRRSYTWHREPEPLKEKITE
ncbi:MAG: hypothetical protein R3C58_14070 [Parvularculaceae bacterium]